MDATIEHVDFVRSTVIREFFEAFAIEYNAMQQNGEMGYCNTDFLNDVKAEIRFQKALRGMTSSGSTEVQMLAKQDGFCAIA